jgi:hypothetical protein
MALPKKIKKNISLEPQLFGPSRRQELLDKIQEHGTYLPKSILHEDLDRGFLDFVKNELEISSEGKKVPVLDILITTQNWAQFTKTWNFNDLDKNIVPPFVTTVRTPEVKYGSTPSLQYTIPNRRQYFYAMVPTWGNDGRKGMDVYTIPQPVPVDIKYSVKIICNRMRELNSFNKKVIEKFSSRQAYTQIKGHYIPIIMDDVSDESVMELEKRKFYMQSYSFTLMGFLIDENEFEVKPAVSRTLALFEVDSQNNRSKKPYQIPNSTMYSESYNYPVSVTSETKTFEYTTNVTLDTLENVLSYNVYVNNLFYGTNIITGEGKKLEVNTNDLVRIDITKTDSLLISSVKLIYTLV